MLTDFTEHCAVCDCYGSCPSGAVDKFFYDSYCMPEFAVEKSRKHGRKRADIFGQHLSVK